MVSSFYPTAGSGCVVQCLPVGGAEVMHITAESQPQRHLLAEGCILFVGPKVRSCMMQMIRTIADKQIRLGLCNDVSNFFFNKTSDILDIEELLLYK